MYITTARGALCTCTRPCSRPSQPGELGARVPEPALACVGCSEGRVQPVQLEQIVPVSTGWFMCMWSASQGYLGQQAPSVQYRALVTVSLFIPRHCNCMNSTGLQAYRATGPNAAGAGRQRKVYAWTPTQGVRLKGSQPPTQGLGVRVKGSRSPLVQATPSTRSTIPPVCNERPPKLAFRLIEALDGLDPLDRSLLSPLVPVAFEHLQLRLHAPVATLRWLVWWCGCCKTTLQLSARWCGGDGGSGADKFAHTARPHASGACEHVLEPRTHGGRSPGGRMTAHACGKQRRHGYL